MMEIEIRPLRPEDQEAALDVVKSNYPNASAHEAFLNHCKASFATEPASTAVHFLGAFIGAKIVGLAGYGKSSIASSIWGLTFDNVLPEYQGQGIGGQLIDARLQKILELNANMSELTALVSATPTRLWKGQGFKELKQDDEEERDPEEKVLLVKKLKIKEPKR